MVTARNYTLQESHFQVKRSFESSDIEVQESLVLHVEVQESSAAENFSRLSDS
jgi:hypothetical protein